MTDLFDSATASERRAATILLDRLRATGPITVIRNRSLRRTGHFPKRSPSSNLPCSHGRTNTDTPSVGETPWMSTMSKSR